MEYKRDANGNIEYVIDLLGNKIPTPVNVPTGPVRYVGFTCENLPRNPSAAALSQIEVPIRGPVSKRTRAALAKARPA